MLPGPGLMVIRAPSPSLIFSNGTAPPDALLMVVSPVTWKTKVLPNLIVIVFAPRLTAVTCPKKECRSEGGVFAGAKPVASKLESRAARIIRIGRSDVTARPETGFPIALQHRSPARLGWAKLRRHFFAGWYFQFRVLPSASHLSEVAIRSLRVSSRLAS